MEKNSYKSSKLDLTEGECYLFTGLRYIFTLKNIAVDSTGLRPDPIFEFITPSNGVDPNLVLAAIQGKLSNQVSWFNPHRIQGNLSSTLNAICFNFTCSELEELKIQPFWRQSNPIWRQSNPSKFVGGQTTIGGQTFEISEKYALKSFPNLPMECRVADWRNQRVLLRIDFKDLKDLNLGENVLSQYIYQDLDAYTRPREDLSREFIKLNQFAYRFELRCIDLALTGEMIKGLGVHKFGERLYEPDQESLEMLGCLKVGVRVSLPGKFEGSIVQEYCLNQIQSKILVRVTRPLSKELKEEFNPDFPMLMGVEFREIKNIKIL